MELFLEVCQLQGPRSSNHHDYPQQGKPWGTREVTAGGEAVSEFQGCWLAAVASTMAVAALSAGKALSTDQHSVPEG